MIAKVTLGATNLTLSISACALLELLVGEKAALSLPDFLISQAVQLRRCGQESKLCIPGESTSATSSSIKALQSALTKGLSWAMGLRKGMYVSYDEIAQREGGRPEYVRQLCSLSLLSPDVPETIVQGKISEELTLERLKSGIPTDWDIQKSLYLL